MPRAIWLREREHAHRSTDHQVQGSPPGRAGPRRASGKPRRPPRTRGRRAARPGGRGRAADAAEGRREPRGARGGPRRQDRRPPQDGGRERAEPRASHPRDGPRRRGPGQGHEGRVRLGRAPPARLARLRQGRGVDVRALRRPPRRAPQGHGRDPRRAEGHRRRPRGPLPGARQVHARSHRGGPRRQDRPGDRPRRGDPPRDAGALAAHQEQPRPHRRPGRRQDGDRRGHRPPDDRGRRARVAQGQAPRRARPRRHGRGQQVPRRVRGPPQGRAQGDRGQRGAHHPVHRRAAHPHRRRRRRGRDGRCQHAQACAGPRRAPLHRRHHPRRVP